MKFITKIIFLLFFLKSASAGAIPIAVSVGTHLGSMSSSTDPSGQLFGAEVQLQLQVWTFKNFDFSPVFGFRQTYFENYEETLDSEALVRETYLSRSYRLQTLHAGLNGRMDLPFFDNAFLSLRPQLGWTGVRLKVDESISRKMYTQYQFAGFGGPFAGISLAVEKSLTPTLALSFQAQSNWSFLDQSKRQGEFARQSKNDPGSPLLNLNGNVSERMFRIAKRQTLQSIEAGLALVYTIH